MVKRSESTLHSVPFKAVGGINFVFSIEFVCPDFVMTRWQCVHVTADTYFDFTFRKIGSLNCSYRFEFSLRSTNESPAVIMYLCEIEIEWMNLVRRQLRFFMLDRKNVMLEQRNLLNHRRIIIIFISSGEEITFFAQKKIVVDYCLHRR